ncbi:methionyl-tRNA formyltransferase [Candidatus Schneideria nysicola]|uniref:methionyl-tRNA formyltransferase n=1 Tax=Candidatus Schneideria nysicola TaxID=1081631 RepID=UPI001CAA6188|nr:methionyl-tRNA formyltransferase [Candidatus Schneideria nysicola]UAJ65150.1 methionyl-tRNA formyltransferase [Candidatus Schneideria nysicola]
MLSSLRIIFAGTPEFATQHLYTLFHYSRHKIIAVFTKPDSFSGRGKHLIMSSVKSFALEKKLPIFQPLSLNTSETIHQIAEFNPDIIVVVAYGLLIPKIILDLPKFGCINVHASLLPRWRGAAPIQRAIIAGDSETGISIIQMNSEIDSGDIIYQVRCNIFQNDTSKKLYDRLAYIGANALLEVLDNISKGNSMISHSQNEILSTYAKKISKKEAKINWTLSAKQIVRYVRAFNPWPISFFTLNDKNMNIKVIDAQILSVNTSIRNRFSKPGTISATNEDGIQVVTGDGILNLTLLQQPGKKVVSAKDMLNSKKDWFIPGIILN